MSKIQIKSIFEQIAESVFTSNTTLDETKEFVINFVNAKQINEKDKKIIVSNINNSKSMIRLQTYVANSLLQYEGHGLGQLNKNNKEDRIVIESNNDSAAL